jgi:hypothetical protein
MLCDDCPLDKIPICASAPETRKYEFLFHHPFHAIFVITEIIFASGEFSACSLWKGTNHCEEFKHFIHFSIHKEKTSL